MQEHGFEVKISIFHKILLYTTLLIFIAMGISTYLSVRLESKVLKEQLIHNAKHLTEDIGSSVRSAFTSLNWIFVENMLKETVRSGGYDVIYAKVVNTNGEVYLASDRDYYGENLDPSLLLDRETLLENYFFSQQKEYGILSILPVNISNERWHIILGLSFKPVKEAIRDLVVRNLSFSAIIFLLGVIGSFFFSKSISRPIIGLANAANTISALDLDQDVIVQSRDEVGLLAYSFKRMIINLKTARKKLESSEQRYRTLVETGSKAGVGICVVQNEGDQKGLIRYANKGIADMSDYSDEELSSKAIQDILYADSSGEGNKQSIDVLSFGDIGAIDRNWLINKTGKKIPIELNCGSTEFRGKKAIVCYIRDNTEKIKAEEQLKSYSENLEKMVSERTAELKKTLSDLQNTQSQLLQSEKMASIGQLAAGVAHEINNPVGFVKSNLGTMNEYREELTSLLDEYRTLETALQQEDGVSGNGGIQKAIENIRKVKDEIDLGFVLDDYQNVINESIEGMERVAKIVADLKNFAHTDKGELEHADINKGIESTLNIVWNEIKYKAEVIKDLGDIPLVKCYPRRLNQVFTNILVNAAQAIENKGEIRIATRADNGHVEIRISDTGCGIPPEAISKIYDPFFTTKEVGKGTGLGLNVAYNIIEKHQGTIDVETEVGKGTTFIINLQIEPDLVE